jgi:hypothetical protein
VFASIAFQAAAFAQPQTAVPAAGAPSETASVLGPERGLLLSAPLVEATETASPEQAAGEPGVTFRVPQLPEAPDGGLRILRFGAPGAAAYRFYFEGVALPAGARMILYGIDVSGRVTSVFGPYTESGPLGDGSFRSRVIPGVEAVIEVQGMETGPWQFRVPRVAALDAGLLADLRANASPDLTEAPEQRRPPRRERTQIELNGKVVTADIIGDDVFVEGDLVVGSTKDLLTTNAKDRRHLAVMRTEASGHWPGGVIPIEIDSSLTGDLRVTGARDHWALLLDGILSFVPHTTQHDFIRFVATTLNICSTDSVGRPNGARIITLGPTCSIGNTRHEIGHALGLHHEQSREDRDRFVKIHWENIPADKESQFEIAAGDANSDIGLYDFASIMHYPLGAFSSNGLNTIEPLVPVPAGVTIGQRDAPSKGDTAAIRSQYGVTLSPAVVTVPAEGGTFAVRVSTQNDRSWNAKDDATWVSISSGSSGMGNGLVQFTVGSNLPVLTQGLTFVSGTTGTLNPTRTATLDVGLAPFAVSASVQIVQAAADCTYSVSPSKIVAGPDPGSYTVNVSTRSYCPWGTAESLPWVTLSPTTGLGTGTVSVKLASNYNTNIDKPVSAAKRTGSIVVAGKSVAIEQAGGCILCPE